MPNPLIYSTATMIAAISQMPKVTTFLRDRYFPTDPDRDIFTTQEVLMDIKDGKQRMAPVVLERKKSITVLRDPYRTDRMTPPLVAPARPLTLDDLNSRGFGESFFPNATPEERAGMYLGQDLTDLDIMHSNREEFIAAKCMFGSGYELPQYADEIGTNEFIPYAIRFYEGDTNPNVYVPANPWNGTNADVFGDLQTMVRLKTRAGIPISDFVGAPETIDAVLEDDKLFKMLDNRRISIGDINPKAMPEGASYYGYITVAGRQINLFAYEAQFIDDQTGEVKPVFAPGQGVLTAPESGRGLYGAVTQLEADDEFHTYSGTRIPKYTTDRHNDVRSLRLASRPLYVPRYANPWLSISAFQ